MILVFLFIGYFYSSVGGVVPIFIIVLFVFAFFLIGVIFISFFDFIFSKQFIFLKKLMSKSTLQLLYFMWNAKKYAVDMGNGEKSQSCFHKN